MEQMTIAALALALLPLLNAATGGAGLWRSLPQGQWSVAGFDLMMLALAAVHGAVVYHLRRKRALQAAAPAVRAAGGGMRAKPALQSQEEVQP